MISAGGENSTLAVERGLFLRCRYHTFPAAFRVPWITSSFQRASKAFCEGSLGLTWLTRWPRGKGRKPLLALSCHFRPWGSMGASWVPQRAKGIHMGSFLCCVLFNVVFSRIGSFLLASPLIPARGGEGGWETSKARGTAESGLGWQIHFLVSSRGVQTSLTRPPSFQNPFLKPLRPSQLLHVSPPECPFNKDSTTLPQAREHPLNPTPSHPPAASSPRPAGYSPARHRPRPAPPPSAAPCPPARPRPRNPRL